jgi:gliding motility-associated lipoprotein GldD
MIKRIFFVIVTVLILVSCGQEYTPKPRGYFRIDFPGKEYKEAPEVLPYSFEIPVNSLIIRNKKSKNGIYWINIEYPQYKATIYLTYDDINKQNSVDKLINDSRTFVYKHTIKADAIVENVFVNNDKKVYGIKYDIKGDAASNIQFFLTDSTKHFLRGSLYFNVTPNKDSLAPVIKYINTDIVHLMETLEWQNK